MKKNNTPARQRIESETPRHTCSLPLGCYESTGFPREMAGVTYLCLHMQRQFTSAWAEINPKWILESPGKFLEGLLQFTQGALSLGSTSLRCC